MWNIRENDCWGAFGYRIRLNAFKALFVGYGHYFVKIVCRVLIKSLDLLETKLDHFCNHIHYHLLPRRINARSNKFIKEL